MLTLERVSETCVSVILSDGERVLELWYIHLASRDRHVVSEVVIPEYEKGHVPENSSHRFRDRDREVGEQVWKQHEGPSLKVASEPMASLL